jgi:hypothetical protein
VTGRLSTMTLVEPLTDQTMLYAGLACSRGSHVHTSGLYLLDPRSPVSPPQIRAAPWSCATPRWLPRLSSWRPAWLINKVHNHDMTAQHMAAEGSTACTDDG